MSPLDQYPPQYPAPAPQEPVWPPESAPSRLPAQPMQPVQPLRPAQAPPAAPAPNQQQINVEQAPPDVRVERIYPVRPVPAYGARWWDRRTRPAYWIYFVLGVIEILIGLRVLLRLLGANPDAGFTSLIYGITYPLVALFQGVFPTPAGHGAALEISSLLAMLIYWLLAWGIVKAVESARWRRPRTTAPPPTV